ncbi:DUF2808 domain-containing protein [Thermosynechococcus sp. FA-CM-4201]
MVKRFLPVLVLVGCSLGLVTPALVRAQANQGFTFTWGEGPSGRQQLQYHLDNGTPGFMGDRYWLRLGQQKVAINRINITYPDYYNGIIDPKGIEVRVGGNSSNSFFQFRRNPGTRIELAEVSLDRDNRVIDIVPAEVIPAGTPVQVILNNVRNPNHGGMYYFNARIGSPGDIPLMRYIGTWILSIANN